MHPDLKKVIAVLVADIVEGRHASIAADGRIGRLTEDELRAAVRQYGKTLLPLPDEAFEVAEVYDVDVNVVEVDIPMWTAEEGRSDLTLCVEALRSDAGHKLLLTDLHVL